MEKIQLYDKCFVPYLEEKQILEAIDRVAEKVNADFRGCTDIPVILCILNGAIMFTSELIKRLDFNFEFASLKLSSYVGTSSTGQVKALNGINGNVKGRRVIVCEDIVDTGNSMEFLRGMLEKEGATEVRICTMLFKPEVFQKSFKLDYVAKEIPNDIIVGYGLDYNELGRGFKDIYVIQK